jgi:hypothetical protein
LLPVGILNPHELSHGFDDFTSAEVSHDDPSRRPGEVLGPGVPQMSAEHDDVTSARMDRPGPRMPGVTTHQALGRNPCETVGSGNEASGAVRFVHVVEHPEGVADALPIRRHRRVAEFISPEFLGIYGIDLVRGRGFADTERNPNAAVAIVRLFDPVAYAASLRIIVAACACAALVPALRAGRVDPVVALRQD